VTDYDAGTHVAQSLAVAHELVEAGIPVFAAPPAPGTKVGFQLPGKWEQTQADHARVDEWQPGWALCMVTGCGLDGIDIDTYADGNLAVLQGALGGDLPSIYGVAATASGGTHLLIASTGVASKNGLFQGIDIKAGEPGGTGRGFLFIAPTVKAHKVTRLPGQYGWLAGGIDLARLLAGGDASGHGLAGLVNASRNGRPAHGGNGNGAAPETPPNGKIPEVTLEQFMTQAPSKASPWKDIPATLKAEGRSNGVMRLAASLRETTSLDLGQAVDEMYEKVWPWVDQSQNGHEFPRSEFEEVIAAVWRQYPGAADKIAESVSAVVTDPGSTGPPPLPHSALDLTDAFLTHWVAWSLNSGWMHGRSYRWAPGLGWMRWQGTRWASADVADVWEEVRQHFIWLLNTISAQGADQALLARLIALLTRARIGAITDLSRGHALIRCDAADFDAHPDLLNTPAGVVDLRTGEVTAPHDSRLMLTKITSGNYRPGFTHPDWEQALTALDPPEREWYQSRIGQAVTGHPPTDGIMPVLQGAGSNGKTVCATDGPVKALGDYADMASHKLITSQKAGSSEHSTEMADLRGQRLLVGEELSEGRSIDVTALKRIMDVSRIKARYVHKDNISFDASHSLFCTTNYRPVISETDHGTWRRLALLVFRYTYHKPGTRLATELDRAGDPELKPRIRLNVSGQHDAIVTWAVQGAMRWYARGMTNVPPTERITADTHAWRISADHVLGFWDELLVADHGTPGEHPPCIGAAHLLAVFNAWLGKGGHSSWTKQTFAARFADHEMTTSSGVKYARTARFGNLSQYTGSEVYVVAEVPSAQIYAWVGVRFKRPEKPPTSGLAELAGCSGNSPSGSFTGKFPGDPASSASSAQPAETSETTENYQEPTKPPEQVGLASGIPAPGEVVFDLETASAKVLFTTTQGDNFVRLAGSLSSGGTAITSVRELLGLLESADVITGHNILGFDLLALAWHHGADWDRLTARARDTEIIERQANPPRSRETGGSLDSYDLDHVAGRLGVPGKTDDLKGLARRHGGYDMIPLDDTEYRSYLEGDLRATAAVSAAMAVTYPPDPYVSREHKIAALAGRMTLTGFLVDQELLGRRIDETWTRSREALRKLHDLLGLPLGKTVMRGRGKARHEEFQEQNSPLSTDEGRAWLERTWTEFGITDPPRTVKTGKLSVGSDDLRAVAARRPDLAGLCETVITAAWPRTVYQTAADCLCPDGRVHPGVSMRQASGRWSVTNPGLTVFGKRGGRHHERAIFLPDPGHVLLSFDLSQVDMRAMAAHSQDSGYMALFEPGKDAHAEIAAQVGVERQEAKAVGHGWNYGLGKNRMIANGLDEGLVTAFIAGMEARFPRLIEWRDEIRARGKSGEILDNGFGRRMRCDPARAYTVAPALMGQGGARDIMCESLLRIPREFDQYMRVMVHDEIVMSVPKKDALEIAQVVKQAMTWNWRGVPILCDMAAGMDWAEVSAK
jgi:putative DNA primase/helicase